MLLTELEVLLFILLIGLLLLLLLVLILPLFCYYIIANGLILLCDCTCNDEFDIFYTKLKFNVLLLLLILLFLLPILPTFPIFPIFPILLLPVLNTPIF